MKLQKKKSYEVKNMNRMDNETLEDVKHMEEEAKYKIITLEDEEEPTSNSIKILYDCKEAVNKLYAQFHEWWKENQNSEEVKARKEKLKQDSDRLIQTAKVQLQKLQENEELKDALNKGVKVAADTGTWVLQTLSEGVDELRKSEGGQKVEAYVSSVVHDERVKQSVTSLKKGTLKLAESAFEGLKKVLDDSDETNTEESEIEVLNNEKNNNL